MPTSLARSAERRGSKSLERYQMPDFVCGDLRTSVTAPPVKAVIVILYISIALRSASAFACAVVGPEHSARESHFRQKSMMPQGKRIDRSEQNFPGDVRRHSIVTRFDGFNLGYLPAPLADCRSDFSLRDREACRRQW